MRASGQPAAVVVPEAFVAGRGARAARPGGIAGAVVRGRSTAARRELAIGHVGRAEQIRQLITSKRRGIGIRGDDRRLLPLREEPGRLMVDGRGDRGRDPAGAGQHRESRGQVGESPRHGGLTSS